MLQSPVSNGQLPSFDTTVATSRKRTPLTWNNDRPPLRNEVFLSTLQSTMHVSKGKVPEEEPKRGMGNYSNQRLKKSMTDDGEIKRRDRKVIIRSSVQTALLSAGTSQREPLIVLDMTDYLFPTLSPLLPSAFFLYTFIHLDSDSRQSVMTHMTCHRQQD